MVSYEQIAEAIRADIRRGLFEPGKRLPGSRDLAVKYGSVQNTAQRALKSLESRGWLTIRPTVGAFVNDVLPADDAEPASLDEVSRRVAELEGVVAAMAERVQKIERHHAAS